MTDEILMAGPSNQNTQEPALVELKNSKVIFKQKSISYEKLSETLQEIVKFREMLEERIKSKGPPLTEISDEFKPVIAKLVHESDKTLSNLAKHIHQELLPALDEDEEDESIAIAAMFSPQVVEVTIKSIAIRVNYGLDGSSPTSKAPAALCTWKWEVNEKRRAEWLPKSARDKAETRIAERVQAKKDLAALFEALPHDERVALIDPKGASKLLSRDTNKTNDNPSASSSLSKSTSKKPTLVQITDDETDAKKAETTPKVVKPKKSIDPDKALKEKERQDKKAAKIEKERKAKEVQNKSRSLMANFVMKAKPAASRASPSVDSNDAGPSSSISDFAKTFKPFILKKDAELAPINWFTDSKNKKPKTDGDVIIIDSDEEYEPKQLQVQMDFGQMTSAEHLKHILSELPPSLTTRSKLNTVTVREVFAQLNEAEVGGDTSLVRELFACLADRTIFPAKVYIFHDDARPGYFGTSTRKSRVINPRRPFAKDVLSLDYSYDSGEEWEEEVAGDADDVVAEDGDDDEPEAADSDLESWLVDDDDAEDIGTPVSDRSLSPAISSMPIKRKAEEVAEKKLAKKRKVVVPLVPFAKGPCWETDLGQTEYDPFKPYRIQMFNDSPFPVDPFTFVSQCTLISPNRKRANTISSPVFAVPALPVYRVPSVSNDSSTANTYSSSTTTTTAETPKRTPSVPKTQFPDAHLPIVISTIDSLKSSSFILIVETIYQNLKDHKIKKNAIEAKVKEVGEKCKQKRIWVLKPLTAALNPAIEFSHV